MNLIEMLTVLGEFFRSIVRPVVTFMIAGALVYGFLAGIVSVDGFLGIAGMVIGFWFKERDERNSNI